MVKSINSVSKFKQDLRRKETVQKPLQVNSSYSDSIASGGSIIRHSEAVAEESQEQTSSNKLKSYSLSKKTGHHTGAASEITTTLDKIKSVILIVI